jgi:hypothetical protein
MRRKLLGGVAGMVMGLALGVTSCATEQPVRHVKAPRAKATVTRFETCAANQHCPSGFYCTTEDGVCDRNPQCGRKQSCAKLCYGACQPLKFAGQGLTIR